MKNVKLRAMSKVGAVLFVCLVGCAALAVTVIGASAASNPPWQATPPAAEVGTLTFYNASGQEITGGNLTDSPIAAYVQGSNTINSGDTTAVLNGVTPVDGENPGQWSGENLSGPPTTFPDASAPAALASSPLPLVAGSSEGESLSTYISDYPNTDTSTTDGYADIYEIRLFTAHGGTATTNYDAADVQVTGSTWSVVYPTTTLTSTTTTLTESPASPQESGTSVTLTAAVSPSAPGTVQFEYGTGTTPTLIGSPVTVASGTASLSTTALPVGSDTLSAVFTPTAGSSYAGSTGIDTYTITSNLTQTTTTLSTTQSSPQVYGTPVTLNAAVTAGVAGSVQFEYTTAGSGTPTVIGSPATVASGTASLSTTALPVGTDAISAVFVPTTPGYATSTSTAVSFVVTAIPTTTTLTTTQSSPQVFGTSVTLNAAVTAGVAGSVQFEDTTAGSGTPTVIGSPVTVASGTASLSTTALPVGTDAISAVFVPTTPGYATSTSTAVSFVISPLTPTTTTLTTTQSSPQIYGTPVTLNAAVTAGVAGSVQFEYTTTGSGTPTLIGSAATVSGGTASTTTTALPVGDDTISAVFSPTTSGYSGSTGTAPFTVTAVATTTALSESPSSPQPEGTSVTLTATVSPSSASGTVQFESGSTDLSTPVTVIGGTANLSTTALPTGTDALSAVFTPKAGSGFGTSTGTASFLVTVAPPSQSNGQSGKGYWLVASDGGIFNGGDAGFFGSGGTLRLNRPVVGVAATPSGDGYWLVASDGGVLTFGDAGFYGSAAGFKLSQPIVGIAATPDGGGYWLVGSDGGVFSFGDAHFYGSAGGLKLNRPIVGIATTPSGGGYWLVASDGGVFAFGNAIFHGSTGALRLNKPIVGIAATPDGGGYWLVASDGGIFSGGDAIFHGSTGALRLNKPIVGIAATSDGGGYWLVASDGGVFTFGDATFHGSAAGVNLAKPIIGLAGA
jgi:hypothetical protein